MGNEFGQPELQIQSRANYPEPAAKLRGMKKEAVETQHKFDPIIGPDRQIR